MTTGTEADTQTILVDHLQNTGWRDETKKTAEQRFRLNISLANTKYSGLIKGKSSLVCARHVNSDEIDQRPCLAVWLESLCPPILRREMLNSHLWKAGRTPSSSRS